MADDDRIVRLTFTLQGDQQFTVRTTAAAAAAIKAAADIASAETGLTNVTVNEVKKRSGAQTQGAATASQAANSQTTSISKIAAATSALGPATDRILTYNQRLPTTAALLKTYGDAVTATVSKTAAAIQAAQRDVERYKDNNDKLAQSLVVLANAQRAYDQALQDQKSVRTVTSTPALGGMDAAREQAENILTRQYEDQLDAAQRYARQGLDPLIARLDAERASAKALAADLHTLDQARKAELLTTEQLVALEGKLIESYNLGAIAAKQNAEERAKLNATVRDILHPTIPGQESGSQLAGRIAPPPLPGGVPPEGPQTGNQARAVTVAPQDLIAAAKESALQAATEVQEKLAQIYNINQPKLGPTKQELEEVYAEYDRIAAITQKYRDQLNPILPIIRILKDEIKAIGESQLSMPEKIEATGRAYSRFAASVASLRKETEASYNSLKEAADKFSAAQIGTHAIVGPPVPTAAQTNAAQLLGQLQTSMAQGQPAPSSVLESVKQLETKLKEMTRTEEEAVVATQQLRDKIDPVGAIYRKAAEDVAKYEAVLDKTNITEEEVNRVTQQINKDAGIRASDASGTTKAADDYERLARAADAYRAKINPLVDAQQQYAQRIQQLTEFQSVGLATDKQTTDELTKLQAGYDRVSKSLEVSTKQGLSGTQISKQFKGDLQQASKDITDFSSTTTRAFGLNRVGFLELQAAGINSFQSLAAGISPLRTAETEGAQVVGALIQGTSLTLRSLLAFAAPLAGVGAAIALIATHLISVNSNLRSFQVQLDTVGRGTGATARGLQDIVNGLRDVGFSADDAKKSVDGLLKLAPQGLNVSPRNIQQISQIGLNISAQTGANPAEEALTLGKALAQGGDALRKYADERGLFEQQSPKLGESLSAEAVAQNRAKEELLKQVVALELLGKKEEEAQVIIKGLVALYDGQYRKSLSGAGNAVDDLSSRWRHFLDTITNSQAVKSSGDELITIVKNTLHEVELIIGFFDSLDKKIAGIFNVSVEAVSKLIALLPSLPDWLRTGTSPVAPGTGAPVYNVSQGATPGPQRPVGTLPTPDMYGGVSLLRGGTVSTDTTTLKSGLTSVTDNISRLNTQIVRNIDINQRETDLTISNDNTESKSFDAAYESLKRLVAAFDTSATAISNVKIPQTVGGMETGGAVGGGSVGGGATVGTAGRVTFGNPFINALAQLESGGRNIPQQIIDSNTTKGTPGEGIFQITRPTAAQFSQGRYSSAFQLDAAGQAALAENVPLGRFGGRTQRGMQAQFGPLDMTKTVGELASQFGGSVSASMTNANTLHTTISAAAADAQYYGKVTSDQTKIIGERDKAIADSIKEIQSLGVVQRLDRAQIEATNSAIAAGLGDEVAATEGKKARAAEQTRINIENQHTIELQDLETQGQVSVTKAYADSDVAGLQSVAVQNARIQSITQGVDVQKTANAELQKNAVAATVAGNAQIAATTPVLARQEALARASVVGAQAEHEQTLINQAHAETYDALSKAQAAYNQAQISGTDADKEHTKVVLDLARSEDVAALAQTRRADIATQVTDLGHALQQNKDQAEILALQVTLQGQTTEEIQKQVVLQQLRQQLGEKYNQLTDQQKQDWTDSVTRAQNFTMVLAEAQRQQERLNQLFQNIGETISSTLGTAIEDAFSGKKIQDWGAQLKQIIAQVLTQIVQFEFIRPAIGTALQAIGLQQAATNFGSLGAPTIGGGGTGALGLLGSVTGATNTVTNVSGGANGGTVTNSIFGPGGFTSFVNNIGGKIGFANPGNFPALSGVSGEPFSATVAGPSIPTQAGSLFGGATLSSVLTGAGVGIGAGITANTLRGGNTLGGTIGSGVGGIGGSLGGAVLGTTLFPGVGTALGAILGGAVGGGSGGLLGGLFGNSTRPNAASGANVDIGRGGVVFGARSSGNQQNDQTVNQITTSVSQFTNTLLTLTKGVESATVNVQAGVRDGIKASIAGAAGTTVIKTKDPTDAINQIELNIAKGLTNVSDTLKTVLANVTDPSQIQSAVTFAATYDDLKTAADNAFSSISTDVKTVGPFATALKSLNDTFASLTDQANQFGLSLDPINKGLVEATKRLRDDFGKALDQALNTANNSDFLNQLTTVAQGFSSNVQEQQAIGLGNDAATTAKINQLESAQAAPLLSALTTAQLKQVEDAFKTTDPEIAAMAQALLDAGISADSATSSLDKTTSALQNFAAGVKSVEETLTQLHTGTLAGLTPAGQVAGAQTNFQAQLATVQAAGPNVTGDQLTQLSNLAQTAIQTAQTVFGNAPQTSDLRNLVINTLNTVLTTTGSSTAATAAATAQAAAPTAATAQAAIQASPAVMSAQANAVLTALHAAGVPGFAMGTMPMMPTGYAKGDPAVGTSSKGTPSGTILVGEEGPEWMLPKGGDWRQVGKAGPELINQPGGATILPYPMTPERAFASGTGPSLSNLGDVATLGSATSGALGGPTLPGIVDIADSLGLGASSTLGAVSIGGATLGTIASGVSIGGAAGSLLNLAIGGNTTNATIGSTGGSIAGTLVGSLLGGPLIGGLIGGLLGGLGGLIGPKPSNNASGDLVDLSTGAISDFRSAGDKRADQNVQEISAGISAVSTTFQKATGGSISGAVNVQDGKRDGIKTSYSGPLGHVDAKWASVEDAIGQYSLAIAHDLVGVASELQASLSGTNDPNALIPTIERFTGASIDLNSGTVVFPPAGGSAVVTPTVDTATVATPAVVVPPPPPTLQQMYDSVVGGDTLNFNNDEGLQNKVNLVSLLSLYGGLTQDQKTNYVNTIQTDTSTWNNTPTGIVNKLGLVETIVGGTNINTTPSMDNLMQQYSALPAYAMGSRGGTPPGKILVGERGPEWIHTGNVVSMETYRQALPNMAGWSLVGKNGPEVIDQKGGATILPFPHTPWEAAGRAFADGTGSLPEMTFAAPTAPSPGSSRDHNERQNSDAALLKKIDELRAEMVALRRVTQGGQEEQSTTAKVSNRHLGDINRKTAPAIVGPRRQKLG